ncbi:tRNA-His guanylyltransferase [Exophiala dermatitidis]|uniref:tRNA(His) guanylyltransferase n=1 Tax=Exophiala dermatitidis TaxID=5970 RepID=A0AAN6ISS3_EXODE|nr:tRNA-His guanylyltransferase [Exophiala dermatitidis]KAJ4513456.1 tRNA-His guanylyltransferase [Exophiala dermatitidis]KAJ4535770.1 tRNA-His guanylyltransferase [Exophiala dermatitidis]KAJ4544630.1 tRNA-His guanylyltransferase [Exophiala dermatitidis]KAJ4561305.1 tRNA-His guanylyltransferase [Exophiala dermatitidis]
MANSKYEYVRAFERDEILLPNTWIVVRIDGRGFHRLSTHYNFHKPNDIRALNLMNAAAEYVVTSIPEIVIAYGVSDEYSFVFHRSTNLFERRAAKLVSTIVSAFTAAYVKLWPDVFVNGGGRSEEGDGEGEEGEADEGGQGLSLSMLPTFDGRAVCYPSWENLRDYLSWRQVDCHINNLYNTTFWALVQQGGMSPTAAEEFLKGTVSSDKNEILWSRFAINYNNELEMFRKGSVVYREYALEQGTTGSSRLKNAEGETSGSQVATQLEGGGAALEGMNENIEAEEEDHGRGIEAPISKTQAEKIKKARQKAKVVTRHVDIIKDDFWLQRPWIRSGKPGRLVEK